MRAAHHAATGRAIGHGEATGTGGIGANDDAGHGAILCGAITFFCSFTSRVVEQVRASMLTEINANLRSTKAFIVTLRSTHSLLPDHANTRVGRPLAPGLSPRSEDPCQRAPGTVSGGRRSRELS